MAHLAASSAQCCVDHGVLEALVRVQESLDAVVEGIEGDRDALLDDVLAARLLVGTVILRLEPGTGD